MPRTTFTYTRFDSSAIPVESVCSRRMKYEELTFFFPIRDFHKSLEGLIFENFLYFIATIKGQTDIRPKTSFVNLGIFSQSRYEHSDTSCFFTNRVRLLVSSIGLCSRPLILPTVTIFASEDRSNQ